MLEEMMASPVLHVPSLAEVPEEALANVYVFENGREGMGPLGFQPDLLVNPPGTEGYSPLRQLHLVTWEDEGASRLLRSAEELEEAVQAGDVTVEQTDVVINMPMLTWPDGQR